MSPIRTALLAGLVLANAAGAADTVQDATRQWQNGGVAEPVQGPDGLLLFPYGQGLATIICRPLYGCDIELQAGEQIQNVMLGDTVRWISGKAKTGTDPDATYHVVLKPTQVGIGTNLLVTTTRRTYVVALKSSEAGSMSRVGWYYPADLVQDWADHAAQAKKVEEDHAKLTVGTLPIANINQLHLDSYEIRGKRSLPWYPVRVFDDGIHVWIQMPQSAASTDAPALVLINDAGDAELVNYRLKPATQGSDDATYYIVDKIFDHGALIVGVGDDQQKIEIVRRTKSSSAFDSLFK